MLAWPCVLLFVGLSIAITASARQSYPVMNLVLGTVLTLLSLGMAAALATNRIVVTEAGLVYWHYLRRSFIGWAFTRNYPARIAEELATWQRQLAPPAGASGRE